jgi:3-hydroxybutyryl-CoA dehydratase
VFTPCSLHIGLEFPEQTKLVVQENVRLYAEASGDYNPIHLDPEFVKKAGLDGTIAHGMLVLAYVSAYMTSLFGKDWLTGGSLNIRFKAPAKPGDVLTFKGKVNKLERQEDNVLATCDISCDNQQKDAVIAGEVKVRIKIA